MKTINTVKNISLLAGIVWAGASLAGPFDFVQPSDGFHFGELTVSPFAEVLYFYDTNYDRVDRGSSSSHGPSLRGGLDYSYAGDRNTFSGQAWYQWENYNGDGRLDSKQWRESLRYMHETPQGTVLNLNHYWAETDQSDYERGQWRDRREFMLGAGIAHAFSPKTRVHLDVGVEDVAYRSPFLYDWRKYSADVSLARRFGAKSDAFINAGTSLEENEDYSGFSKAYRIGLGMASRATEKVSYRVVAGAEAFDYNGRPRGSTDWAPYYQLGATWNASSKWTWTLTGRGEHRSSEEYGSNYTRTYTLGVGAAYQANRRLSLSMRSLWRYDESEYRVTDFTTGRSKDKRDHELGVRTDVTYRLNKYASLRVGGEATTQISSIDADEYNRFRVDMGLMLRY
mgnify:CR=1 FL=1